MMFNTLGVAACASIFTKKPIQIDWWPITRDSIIFSINISILVIMAWDGVIMWYETCILVTLYVGYWILMFQNPKIMKFVKHVVEDRLMWCQRIKNYDIANQRPYDYKVEDQAQNNSLPQEQMKSNRESYKAYDNSAFDGKDPEIATIEAIKVRNRSQSFDINAFDMPAKARRASTDLSIVYADEEENEDWALWEIPRDVTRFDIFWFFFTWPIRFLLHYTIPNPIKYKKWFVMSFVMCIVWIAGVSYM
jgi:solute carrier family 24 (sodium/potassium/calcium exchanger), member 4